MLALGLLLTLRYAVREDYRKALPLYLITVLVKPQALMLAPLGLCALLVHWAGRKWDKAAIKRALDLYNNDRPAFRALQKRGMETDFSWDVPAGRYMELFRNMLSW